MTDFPDWVRNTPSTPAIHNEPPQNYQWQNLTSDQLASLRKNLVDSIIQVVVSLVRGILLPGDPGGQLQQWAQDVPLLGPLLNAITGSDTTGGGGLAGLGAFFGDLTGLLGDPSGLGSGTPTLPGIGSVPLLGGLFSGGSILGSLIPGLDASKITTGTFGLGFIPNLPASQITSGTFGTGLIPNLPASIINSGSFLASLIPSLDASKITTGTFGSALVQPVIDAVSQGFGGSTGLNFAALQSFLGGLSFGGISFDDLIGLFPGTTGGLSGSTGLESIFDDLSAVLGSPTALGSGTPALPGIGSIPLLGGLLSGGSLLGSLIPGLDASKITTGVLGTGLIPNITKAMSTDMQAVIDGVYQAINGGSSTGNTVASVKTGLLAFPGANLVGSVASSLLSGTLGTGLIPGLDASKITTGTFGAGFIPNITKAMSTDLQGVIDAAYQAVNGGSSTGNTVASVKTGLLNIPGANIASALLAAVIPSLDASKITTGAFGTGQIPNLPASIITSGTFGTGLIPNLAASIINSGTFAGSLIPNLDASKITTGTLGTGLLPNITRSMSTDLQSTIDQFFQGYTGSGTTGNAPSVLNSSVAASINARITALEGGGTLTQYTTSATWTNPTPAAHNLITIICINGGQGGGKPGNQTGGGSPGISGGYKSQQFYTDQISASYAMTIGTGGGGSTTAGAAGTAGGTTSMGGLLVGAAGVGSIIKADGTYSVAIPPGDGGFGAGGSTTSGGAAFHAENGQSGPFAAGGRGGLGAVGGTGTAAPSGVPSGGGGGGGGGVTGTATVSAGGAGGAPGGGGGGGGNIGTNEANGAAGAAGCIYVIT